MAQEVLESITDRVATLTLNRPERLNALTMSMTDALLEALPRLAADSNVGVIVLTGAGRGFCAGGDVKNMATRSRPDDIDEAARVLRSRMEVSRFLHEIAKPTIAMVNGPAAGAGCAMALACDLRVAAESARFITAFAKVGLSGDFGGSYFLSKLIGTARARELYYTGEALDAKQAYALGIAYQVVPDSELTQATVALATRLARGPGVALGLMKRNLNAAESGTLSELLDLEARHQIETYMTEDHLEAARAFVEKRAPVFKGH